jgi:uncharacterized protein (TIGR03067 family)
MATDHEALQGFWKLVTATRAGEPFDHPDSGTLFQFIGNRFRHIRTRLSCRFELHPETIPKGIDIILVSTRSLSPGIYELEGDTLRMMKTNLKATRPASFDDPRYDVQVYTRFKRRVPIKRRVKAQIPETLVPGSFIPKDFLDD